MGCSLSCGCFYVGLPLKCIGKNESNMNKPVGYSDTKTRREDRRNNVRYLITGTVWFQWLAADGNWYNGIGTTRDCGKEGLFIQSDSRPPMASPSSLSCNSSHHMEVRHFSFALAVRAAFATSSGNRDRQVGSEPQQCSTRRCRYPLQNNCDSCASPSS